MKTFMLVSLVVFERFELCDDWDEATGWVLANVIFALSIAFYVSLFNVM
jgi:hypothetical protein